MIPLIDMPNFASPEVLMALLALTFLEIVLGVDNIIFISLEANKLPEEKRKRATNIGLILAMGIRIALLFGISILTAMEKPWLSFDLFGKHIGFSGQSIILILGGLFLLYKAVAEIHHKLEGDEAHGGSGAKKGVSITNVIIQITLINIVFSIDSILTAVGMTAGIDGALPIMILGVVFSVIAMMLFAIPLGRFINNHPTIQILGLSFLILIAFLLIAEGAHKAHLMEGAIPKGYLYFAIAFSLGVEALNMRMTKKRKKPLQLHGISEEAHEKGMI